MSDKVTKLQASIRKRAGYCNKYKIPTGNDVVMMRLEKTIRQERIKAMKKSKRSSQLSFPNMLESTEA